jgi:hypothetical protein
VVDVSTFFFPFVFFSFCRQSKVLLMIPASFIQTIV